MPRDQPKGYNLQYTYYCNNCRRLTLSPAENFKVFPTPSLSNKTS